MSATSQQERWLLVLSGALFAVLAALPPVGYLLLSLRYEAGALETEAAAVAHAVGGLVSANPDLWRFEQVRLEEILQRRVAEEEPTHHLVLDVEGRLVANDDGVDLPPPHLRRSAPILDAGVTMGRVEVLRSARPAALRALLLAMLLCPAALWAFLLLRGAVRRAAAAREVVEAHQRQAQRLEAVGRLAGGVAHEFNNVLAAVLSSARELRRELPPGSPHLEPVEDMLSVSQRGVQVTRSLMAFSRQQALGLRRGDAGALVRGVEGMLRGTLGPDHTLRVDVAPGPLPVEVDPEQLELVLVNLAANARDAMGPGGTLAIETASVALDPRDAEAVALPPGPYVRIVVHDDGDGMKEEVRQLVFDPFFTTKEVGRGNGLGLAMAHGVVQQHHGAIEVESAPGRGTTFTILLPRAHEGAPGRSTAAGGGAQA